ncbi:MAG: metallophosphoesterase [Treponema sp.]|jgi:hypothetical protein|nr:metallophosphoesterase [Treponema sp.]
MRFAIGDIHGRTFWKKYIKKEFSEFYFVGDYFDSFDKTFGQQYANFAEICNYARNDSRIKLCLGNHDYHYLDNVDSQRYSGFQEDNHARINQILEENMDLIKVVRKTNDRFLISHAGVTNYFLRSLNLNDPEEINEAFTNDRNILNFNGENIYGDDITQSPIWIRPSSLYKDALAGYSQIVGHTPLRKIDTIKTMDKTASLVFIDTHDICSIFEF